MSAAAAVWLTFFGLVLLALSCTSCTSGPLRRFTPGFQVIAYFLVGAALWVALWALL